MILTYDDTILRRIKFESCFTKMLLLVNLLLSWLLLSQKYIVAQYTPSYIRNVAQENVRYFLEHFRCEMTIWSNLTKNLSESQSHGTKCDVIIRRPPSAIRHSVSIQLYSGSKSLTGQRDVEICQLSPTPVNVHFSCGISQTAGINEWCFSNKDCVPRHSVCSVTNIFGQCTCPNGTVFDKGKCFRSMGFGEQCETNEDCGVYNAFCKNKTCQCTGGFYRFYGNCIRENVSFGSPCITNRQCKTFSGTCENNQCGCPYGHYLYNGTCIKENVPFRYSCLTDRQCSTFGGTCQNGRCGCPDRHFLSNNWCRIEKVPFGSFCLTNRQCSIFGGTCENNQCRCPCGHYLSNNTCIKENVSFGSPCITNRQCKTFSGTCENNQCGCPYGHYLYNGTCIKENVPFRYSCLTDRQCSTFGGTCQNGRCRCPDRHFLSNNWCRIENVQIGFPCLTNRQCRTFRGTCKNGRCGCPYRYLFLDNRCTRGDVKLGLSCHYRQQCTGTPNANVCLGNSSHGKCSCNIGFIEYNSSCIDIPKTLPSEKIETLNPVALAVGCSVGGVIIGAAFTFLFSAIYKRSLRRTKTKDAYELQEIRNVNCSTAIYNEFPAAEDRNRELGVEESGSVVSRLVSPCVENGQHEIELGSSFYNHLNEETEVQGDVENKYDYVQPIQSTPRQHINDDVYTTANYEGGSQNPCLYELQRVLTRNTSTE